MTKIHITTLAALLGFGTFALSGAFFGEGAQAATEDITAADVTAEWTELDKDAPPDEPKPKPKPPKLDCGLGSPRVGDHCPGGTNVCAGCCCPSATSECRGVTCLAKRERKPALSQE